MQNIFGVELPTVISLVDLPKRLQHSYQEIIRVLSRDYNLLIRLLSRDYKTPIKRLLHSYQEIIRLLSRDYKTPIKRLQHSYQEIIRLLIRDCNTLIKRSQHSYQELQQNITKMLEYLNFCLLCALLALIFYLYIRTKRYLNILKMAEEIFSGYDPLQSDSKRQKLLECTLTRNSKMYLGKVYTKDQLKKLNDEEVENSLTIMKLSYQARWRSH